MRPSHLGWVLAVSLCAASQAHAQFQNRHLGFEVGLMRVSDSELSVGIAGILEGNFYIENGFDVGVRVPFVIFLTNRANTQRFGLGGTLYARYLISEESLRPYVSAGLDFIAVIRENNAMGQQQSVFFGPQFGGGLDYFSGDSVSIGARAYFTLFFAVNNSTPVRPGGGGGLNIKFYF